MNPKRVGFLGFDGVTALDLVGPAEVFATAVSPEPECGDQALYEVVTIGVSRKPFTSDSGLVFRAAATLEGAPALDTLIVPGGAGLREPHVNARVTAWVKSRAGRIRRVASVCTGIYGLAPSGLLDGRRVTTHWKFTADLARRFPQLRVEPNALFVKDGAFYTSAGVTSGIDLSLALVEEDFGPQVALAAARMLVVYLKRAGGQEQYSEPLRFQTQSSDRFSDLAAWMAGHLHRDLSVEALARRASVCGRHFSRRFKHVFGSTPAAFVEDLRLNEARRLLSSNTGTIESVADSVGFRSADSFRRAFERRFGISPTSYRGRFGLRREAS
ncbi:MAG TPA: GlxA family transcriptional regulator [Candidatus Sulfotelmatobacter sp.]|nr:GlxA family transcriptional regulator [Candidatus Sulfotelmatobacter sp.]